MTGRITVIAGALAAGLAGAAHAQPALEQLAGADRNGDDVITCDEARGFRAARFQEHDLNHDRSIDQTEFRAALPEPANWFTARLGFARFDVDSDGRVSEEELAAAPLAGFERADEDGDCQLASEELNAALARKGLQ